MIKNGLIFLSILYQNHLRNNYVNGFNRKKIKPIKDDLSLMLIVYQKN